MNIKLIWFWILFTASMVCITLGSKDRYPELSLIFGTTGLFGFYMVLLILLKHKKFRMSRTDKQLSVQQIGRRKKTYKLENLENWSEKLFIFRGQQKSHEDR